LHIHDTHFISLVCGFPKAVHSRGNVEDGAVVYMTTQYLYDNSSLSVSADSGAISQSGRPFMHGFEIFLEGATLSFEFANLGGGPPLATPLSLILDDGTVDQPSLGSGDPIDSFTAEIEAATSAVSSASPSPLLSADLAMQALRLCYAEIESVRSGM